MVDLTHVPQGYFTGTQSNDWQCSREVALSNKDKCILQGISNKTRLYLRWSVESRVVYLSTQCAIEGDEHTIWMLYGPRSGYFRSDSY